MKYKDFESKIKSGTLSINDTYWIADYRHENLQSKQPTRNIPPTEVAFIDILNEPKPLHLSYYIFYFFRPIGKNGSPLSKIILPQNYYNGTSVQVFLTENEARSFYVEQCHNILDDVSHEREELDKKFSKLEELVQNSIQKHKP